MRTGITQSSPTALPLVKVTIGTDIFYSQGSEVADADERILSLTHDEQAWGGRYEIVLDNSDEALNTKDYKGKEVVVNFSFVGETAANLPSIWVHGQGFSSQEGKLTMVLACVDVWEFLQAHNVSLAAASYNQDWQNNDEPDPLNLRFMPDGETLVADTSFYADILANSDKTIWEIVFDLTSLVGVTVSLDDNDGIINTRKPPMSVTDARSGVRQAMDMTKSYLRWTNSDILRVIEPDKHAVVYSYNVSNLFFSNAEEASVVIPNTIYVWSITPDGTDWHFGEAVDNASVAELGTIERHFMMASLSNNNCMELAELNALADGLLEKTKAERNQGILIAPMHCTQELFDKVTVVDDRYQTSGAKTITGFVHRIVREYNRGVYRITLQLGGTTTGWTAPGGTEAKSLAEAGTPTAPATVPKWDKVLPRAIQGYHHDITFTADGRSKVDWTSGTIKFYDGTTQSISAGSHTFSGTYIDAVHYLYFDLGHASPGVIKVTHDYLPKITMDVGLLCIAQRGSAVGVDANVIPSYGKQPLITADVIHMAGMLEYDFGSDKKIQAIVSTEISAGHIKLTTDQNLANQGFELISDNTERVRIDSSGVHIKGERIFFYEGASEVARMGSYSTSTEEGVTLSTTNKDIKLWALGDKLRIQACHIQIAASDEASGGFTPDRYLSLEAKDMYLYTSNNNYIGAKKDLELESVDNDVTLTGTAIVLDSTYVRLPLRTSHPTITTGGMIFRTDTKKIQIYDGSAWKTIAYE